MLSLLLAVIYLIFISLGLPDSLLGSGWPTMQNDFDVPSSYAGYVSMTISFMTIISALLSPGLIKRFHTKWIVTASIGLTIVGLLGFSFSESYWMLFVFAVPYGLGAGAIDTSVNHYIANNYPSSVMNFLHCFYGIGAVISPNIMALALKYAHWNEGYRWTAFIQTGIFLVVVLSLPLWKKNASTEKKESKEAAGIKETLKRPGVIATLVSFFAYCAGESTCFLWTSSYFAGARDGVTDEMAASFGSLIFGGLMLGRLLSGFISNKFGDIKLIRIGLALEILGIALIAIPLKSWPVGAVGFFFVGFGMSPVFPAIQHRAPEKFGRRFSAAVIGLQMVFAYVANTSMPMAFGHIQQHVGIWMMPFYLLFFAVINLIFFELSERAVKQK